MREQNIERQLWQYESNEKKKKTQKNRLELKKENQVAEPRWLLKVGLESTAGNGWKKGSLFLGSSKCVR